MGCIRRDDDHSTTDDQVLVSGELTAELGFTFKLSFDVEKIPLNPFNYHPNIDANAIDLDVSLNAKMGAIAALELKGTAALGVEKEVLLGMTVLPPIIIGPVVLVPMLSANAGIEGKVSISFQMGMSQPIGFSASMAYKKSDGLAHNVETPTADFQMSESAVHLGATAKAWVRPELSILAYSAVGATAGVEAYVRAEVNIDQEPYRGLYGGFNGTIGIALQIYSYFRADERIIIPILEKRIAEGHCTLPPEVPSIEPTFESTSTYIPDIKYTTGGFTDWADLQFTTDGRFVVASATSNRLIKVKGDGTPIWSYGFKDMTGHPKDSILQSVTPTIDAGLLVGAHPHTFLKLSAGGQLEWARKSNPSGEVKWGFRTAASTQEDTLVAGYPFAEAHGDPDLWLIKRDRYGEVLWSKLWGKFDVRETAEAILTLHDG